MAQPMTESIDNLRRQARLLKTLHDDGTLSDQAFREARHELERRLVDAVLDAPASAQEPAAPASGDAPPAAASLPAATPAPAAPAPRSNRLVWGVAAAVLMFGVAGYAVLGSPGLWQAGPSASGPAGMAAGAPEAAPHPTNRAQIQAMVAQLAERLKTEPDDAEGWAMLARSYAIMGRHGEARPAYEKALALRADDASLMADYADTLAMTQGGQLKGAPLQWVAKALKAEPDNVKALSLSATDALLRQDYAGAIAQWERVVALAPADSSYVSSARDGITEARQRAGLPPAADAAAARPALAGQASVSGTVRLAPALAAQASPQDTVFILARSADPAQRMPLAILRRSVADLPIRFTLDDSASMSPAARLSGATRVIVSARVSKSGQAMPGPGDIASAPVETAVGAQDLALELNQPVR